MMRSQHPPRWAYTLGWLGIIPFVTAAIGSFSPDPMLMQFSAELGARYGVSICIFLGAIHWGMAINEPHQSSKWRYLWSVTPSLIGVMIMLMPANTSHGYVIALLGLCWLIDVVMTMMGILPSWYMRMRHGLTLVAIISLSVIIVRLFEV
jgi:hypothetical protein